MRVLKGSLAAVVVLTGVMIWLNRSFWIDAYSGDREPIDLTIGALDLSFRADTSGPSPFELQDAPNTLYVALPAVGIEAAPVPKVTVQGGSAQLKGLISGPTGPLQGAEVVIQRFTTDGAAVVRTQTNAEGRWRVRNMHGGRFRVRAYVPGQFGSSGSEVFFLKDGEIKTHNVNLAGPSDAPIVTGLAFGEAFVGGQGTALVFVANRVIDDLGRTQQVPSAGIQVTLIVDGLSVVLTSSATATTDLQGYATFRFSCAVQTAGQATALINDTAYPVTTTPCQAAPAPIDPGPGDPAEPEPSQ